MHYALILAIASTAAAQYFPNQPSCAIPCLSSAISAVGCPATDISCQCGPTQAAIGAAAAGCLLTKCNLSEVSQAQSAGVAVCSSFSAGLLSNIPASTTASGSGSGSSGSMSMTQPPSTASSSASGATASSTSTSGGSGSSGSGSSGSSGSSTRTGSSASTTTIVTTGSNGLPTTTVSTTTRPNVGATPGPMIGAGILAGVIGAVVAL
ncbi:uncharacterized protein B0I36DRAFT_314374 [Microdochium trichocladiopsis]|uniref:CFEM domain-containing protein n=1 Tax=Microdochium trichocladiopsis TaxID=1682393 RepID=A0A9P8YGM0_9PEZI|nr:uncharacterized protein B0I36DRAFT_314374 [Microdochium trichocladiopsis]KAH7037583.1 hypothetical protein B0I36DRAFT_314374 [Microdochium trichocladiopsis]